MDLLYHNREEFCRRKGLLQMMDENPAAVLCPAEGGGLFFLLCTLDFVAGR